MDDISCLMWREERDGSTYSLNIKRGGKMLHREGLSMAEALDLIESEIGRQFDAGMEDGNVER